VVARKLVERHAFLVDALEPTRLTCLRLTAECASGGIPPLHHWHRSSCDPPNGTLGYEWDVDADNGFRPAGLFLLSTTTLTVPTVSSATHRYLHRHTSPYVVPRFEWTLSSGRARCSGPGDWMLHTLTLVRQPIPTCSRQRESSCRHGSSAGNVAKWHRSAIPSTDTTRLDRPSPRLLSGRQ